MLFEVCESRSKNSSWEMHMIDHSSLGLEHMYSIAICFGPHGQHALKFLWPPLSMKICLDELRKRF